MADVDNPLFQLNLLLWCSVPEPPPGIHPLFANHGYEVFAIAPRLTVPPELLARLRGLGSRERSDPELVLRAVGADRFLVVECKADSFGIDSENSRQLFVLLAVHGDLLRDALGLSATHSFTSELAYVIASDNAALMEPTLAEARARLRAVSISPQPACSLRLEALGDGIYLRFTAGQPLGNAALMEELQAGSRLLEHAPGRDWRPLFLLPIDPSIAGLDTDSAGRAELEERVRVGLIAIVGGQIGPQTFEFSVEDVLSRAIPLWEKWEAQAAKVSLRKFAQRLAGQLLTELATVGVLAAPMAQRRFRVDSASPDVVTRARRRLRVSQTRQMQLDLAVDTGVEQTELFGGAETSELTIGSN